MNFLDADKEAFELNRLSWDERVVTHAQSRMYQRWLLGIQSRQHCLDEEHIERMGPVAGKRLLHLQCHIGLETLSWARLGAEVTGVDFSGNAINVAAEYSRALKTPARFIRANVYDVPDVIPEQFDIVFISVGSICWLPNIWRWAKVVSHMLKPGGKLYMEEVHPFADVLEEHPTQPFLIAKNAYFHEEGIRTEENGTYADLSANFTHNTSVTWTHPIGSVINALIKQNMVIRSLDETAECVWPRFKQMIEINPNLFELPEPLAGKLPMMYTLVAEKGRLVFESSMD